ncbi:MAG TPA: GNAT family N-acetyltransferase [Rhizomicrobium sp.]|jgi:RimJ/RimL family protein N-acetyltransferase
MTIAIRALDPAEWEMLRDFRLQALKSMPGVFMGRFEDSVDRPEAEWRDFIRGPFNQAFGLFDGDTLIGITAVFQWREDPSGESALLAASFILERYRGRHLSRLLYDARLNWIARQPVFKRVVVGHRQSNEVSRRANQRYGFTEFRRAARVWPDGTREDEILYERKP